MKDHARPRRILMTADSIGGVWTFAIDLARALAPRTAVVLAVMGRPCSHEQRRAASRVRAELHESDFRLEWMEDPWEDIGKAGDWLLQIAQEARVDLVHLNTLAHGDLPWNRPVLSTVHSCVCSWWEGVHGCAPSPEWNRYRDRVSASLAASGAVTAPSAAQLQAAQRLYGPFRASAVVHNGRARDRFGPQPKQPLILAAGRLWDEAKNVRALDRVAGRLAWPVFVAGEGHAALSCQGLRNLGQLSHEQLARWMSVSAIYAAPAFYEPFGLSILEAACSGCALVLADIPSLRELWDGAALFVPPRDDEALVNTLNQAAADREMRTWYAAAALERARRYSAERMAAGYADLYTRVAAVQPASTAVEGVLA